MISITLTLCARAEIFFHTVMVIGQTSDKRQVGIYEGVDSIVR